MLSLVGRIKTMHFRCFMRSFDRAVSIRSNKYTSFCSMSDWLNAIEMMLVCLKCTKQKIHKSIEWMTRNQLNLANSFYRILVHEKYFHARSRFIRHFVDVQFHSCYHIHICGTIFSNLFSLKHRRRINSTLIELSFVDFHNFGRWNIE